VNTYSTCRVGNLDKEGGDGVKWVNPSRLQFKGALQLLSSRYG